MAELDYITVKGFGRGGAARRRQRRGRRLRGLSMRRLLIAAWLLGVTDAAPARAQESVDLLLHNGKVFAADELLSTYSAVAVRDGRIAALGWDELANRYRAARTIDLEGRLVLPGFIDTHIHISGDAERWVDLSGLENLAELKGRVTRKANSSGRGSGSPGTAGRKTSWPSSAGPCVGTSTTRRRPTRWC